MTNNPRIDCFANGFLSDRSLPYEVRIGRGLVEMAKYTDISFKDYILPHAEWAPSDSGTGFMFASGIKVMMDRYDMLIEKYPEEAEALREHREEMFSYLNYDFHYAGTDVGARLGAAKAGWGGGWGGHANPDFGKIINVGTDAIREEIEKYRALNPDKDAFYTGCRLAMDSLDILGERFHALAAELAESCEDPENKKRYEAAARAFEVIPRRPAYDFTSAVHAFWFIFTVDGIDSPGRLDQMLRRCYELTDDKEEIHDMLSRLWDAFHETRTWHVTLGGSDENWNDMCFGLTYDMLKMTEEKGYNTPNLSVRTHKNTPEAIWRAAADCLAAGTALPTLYNDHIVCAALEKVGIPPHDSHEYCMNGCNQIDIYGKSHMGLEDGEVCLAKCVEFALYNGCDPMCPVRDRYSVSSGDARKFKTFDEFMRAVKRQVSYVVYGMTLNSNASQHAKAYSGHNPLRSCLTEGC
ncbi:MAG: pyruvate formate lyase family protein, partial [Clostridia bacterium]|nr:pyruvate formate lyase family protein [Clostridia bacterium]